MEGGWTCLAAATSAFRGEAANKDQGQHPSQVLKPSILPFPTAKEWKQTPGGLCVWPWGARVAAGTGVEPGAVCTEVGGSSF